VESTSNDHGLTQESRAVFLISAPASHAAAEFFMRAVSFNWEREWREALNRVSKFAAVNLAFF
jgi:hypothetical protein